MRHPLIALLVATIGAMAPFAPGTLVAQSGDPSESYLNAYMGLQQADKLEREGSLRAALAKYRYAGSLLDQIHAQNPQWQTLIVEYRKRKTADAIAKLEQKLALEAPASTTTTATQPELNPNLLPGVSDAVAPSATATAGSSEEGEQGSNDIRKQLATLKKQLQLSRDQLKAAQQERAKMAAQLTEALSKINQGQGSSTTAEDAAQARTEESNLRKQLEQSQIRQSQLEEALNAAKTKAEEENKTLAELKAQLDQANESAAKAQAQLEKTKATEAELKAQLEKTQQDLTSSEVQQAAADEIKQQVEKLQNALAEAQADREVAEEQDEISSRRLRELRTGPDLSGKLAEAEQKIQQLAREKQEVALTNEKLNALITEAQQKAAALTETEKRLADTQAQLTAADAEKAKLTGQLDEAQKRIAELADPDQQIVQVAQERDAAKAEKDALSKKLEATEQQAKKLAAERDSATLQRDEALDKLTRANEAKLQVDKLLAENNELMKKLDDAQQTIKTFKSSSPDKDKQIVSLKSRISGYEDQLATLKKENLNKENYIAELQAQLDNTELSSTGDSTSSEENKKLAEENKLLRGIVLREMKEQARREQARKLILSELSRLQVRSKALNEQVDLLSQPVNKLSEKERALFRTPQMEIVDNNSGEMEITISAPQTDSPEGTASEAPAPDASTPPTADNTTAVPGAVPGELPTGGLPTLASNSAVDSSRKWNKSPKVETENKPNVPPEFQNLAQDAKEKLDRGQYVEAERTYEKLLSQIPTNLYALSNLGVARFRGGKLKLAEETFKKVIALAPDDAFAYSTLGIVYYQQGRPDEAINALTRSLAINTKNPTAHLYLGIAAAHKGWTEAAQKEIEAAIQIDPNYADAHFNMAVLMAYAKPPDKDNARKHYKRAMDLGSDPDPTLDNLLK